MASKRFEKNSTEWQMFTEFWTLCQKYWGIEDNEEYWKSVTDETVAFGEKYKTEFARKIAVAFLESLTERNKAMKE